MLLRDLYYMQKTADYTDSDTSNFHYVNMKTNGMKQIIEACDRRCYLRRTEAITGSGMNGVYSFYGKSRLAVTLDIIHSNEQLVSNKGEIVGDLKSNKYTDLEHQLKPIGEYKVFLNREELFDFLKTYRSQRYPKNTNPDISFAVSEEGWTVGGKPSPLSSYFGSLEKSDKDTVIGEENFRFTTFANELNFIVKWFESEEIVLYFQNICGKATGHIYIKGMEASDNNKLAMIVGRN